MHTNHLKFTHFPKLILGLFFMLAAACTGEVDLRHAEDIDEILESEGGSDGTDFRCGGSNVLPVALTGTGDIKSVLSTSFVHLRSPFNVDSGNYTGVAVFDVETQLMHARIAARSNAERDAIVSQLGLTGAAADEVLVTGGGNPTAHSQLASLVGATNKQTIGLGWEIKAEANEHTLVLMNRSGTFNPQWSCSEPGKGRDYTRSIFGNKWLELYEKTMQRALIGENYVLNREYTI